jgi:hypothetical protein
VKRRREVTSRAATYQDRERELEQALEQVLALAREQAATYRARGSALALDSAWEQAATYRARGSALALGSAWEQAATYRARGSAWERAGARKLPAATRTAAGYKVAARKLPAATCTVAVNPNPSPAAWRIRGAIPSWAEIPSPNQEDR